MASWEPPKPWSRLFSSGIVRFIHHVPCAQTTLPEEMPFPAPFPTRHILSHCESLPAPLLPSSLPGICWKQPYMVKNMEKTPWRGYSSSMDPPCIPGRDPGASWDKGHCAGRGVWAPDKLNQGIPTKEGLLSTPGFSPEWDPDGWWESGLFPGIRIGCSCAAQFLLHDPRSSASSP